MRTTPGRLEDLPDLLTVDEPPASLALASGGV